MKLAALAAIPMLALSGSAVASTLNFVETTPGGSYSFTLDTSTEQFEFLGFDFRPTTVTSSLGSSVVDVSTFIGLNISGSPLFSFTKNLGQNFIVDDLNGSQPSETFAVGTFTGVSGEDSATLSITDAAISGAPEPGAWALLFAGVAMLGAVLRFVRRRQGALLAA